MTIRNLKDIDFNEVLKFLNRNLEFDFLSAEILNEKLYLDPDFDYNSTFVGETDNKIVGFIQGVTRYIENMKYGYIKLFAVDKNQRRQGLGKKLYEKVASRFQKKKVSIIRVYDAPLNYFMPGIDPRYTAALCFFERLGFRRFGEACNLKVDLQKQDWSVSEDIEKLKKDDILISRVRNIDKKELLEFVEQEWKLWKHEIRVALKSKPPAVHIAREKGKIKAFSAYNGNNIDTGWFGPMGTHPDLRGKGIGGILLKLCLQDMKEKGFNHSTIAWVGPISFYSYHANAVVDRVFWRYEKIVSQ